MSTSPRTVTGVPYHDQQTRSLSLAKQSAQADASVHLTAREKQILSWIGEDLNTTQIAKKLKLSPKTVEFHRRSLRKKLGGVAAMVRYGIKTGLLRP